MLHERGVLGSGLARGRFHVGISGLQETSLRDVAVDPGHWRQGVVFSVAPWSRRSLERDQLDGATDTQRIDHGHGGRDAGGGLAEAPSLSAPTAKSPNRQAPGPVAGIGAHLEHPGDAFTPP